MSEHMGWVCPACQRVNGPSQTSCEMCSEFGTRGRDRFDPNNHRIAALESELAEKQKIIDGPDEDTVIRVDWSSENPEPPTALTVENFMAAMDKMETEGFPPKPYVFTMTEGIWNAMNAGYFERFKALESELAATKRECEGLREVVVTAYNMSADAIELNHDNYTEEQVFQLNNEMIDLFLYLLKDGRSVAAREAAEQAIAALDATEGGE